MATFITIGYGAQEGYDATPKRTRDLAPAYDAQLVVQGAVVGIAGEPTQVRNRHNSGIVKKSGPFLSADLPLAGFMLIEADTLEDAIAMVSKTPCAIADGVVEVWPLISSIGE